MAHREQRRSVLLLVLLATVVLAATSYAQDSAPLPGSSSESRSARSSVYEVPQRIRDNSRTGSLECWRITGIGWVGAMLYLGTQSCSSEPQ
jgi:hypothetical protein